MGNDIQVKGSEPRHKFFLSPVKINRESGFMDLNIGGEVGHNESENDFDDMGG